MSEETAAQKRAAARKAKILARGNDRLSKITNTARGEEGAKIFQTESASLTEEPVSQSPVGDPEEVDLATLPTPARPPGPSFDQMFNVTPPSDDISRTSPGNNVDNDNDSPDDMMAELLRRMSSTNYPGGPSSGATSPGDLSQLMAMASQQQQQQQQDPTQQTQEPQRPKSLLERMLPLIHLLSMVGLAVFAIVAWEPSNRLNTPLDSSILGVFDSKTWASLGSRQAIVGELAVVPLFYAFVTIELLLHSIQYIANSRYSGPSSGIIANVLPFLPPNLATYVLTAQRYWTMIGTLLDDLATLIVVLSAWVLWNEWKYQPKGY